MGKKGGAKNMECRSRSAPVSLREEATGKIQLKAISNTKSKLGFEHLKNLTVWASTTDPLIPSLAAFYGHQFAAFKEAHVVPPDSSLITCQRCETFLQPGFNSSVRIEKNKPKVRNRHKKSGGIIQNNVVFECHYCSRHNLKRGTPRGHIKRVCPSKDKSLLQTTPPSKLSTRDSSKTEIGIVSKDEADGIDLKPMANPSSTNMTAILLEGNKRRRNSSSSEKANKTPLTHVKGVEKIGIILALYTGIGITNSCKLYLLMVSFTGEAKHILEPGGKLELGGAPLETYIFHALKLIHTSIRSALLYALYSFVQQQAMASSHGLKRTRRCPP
ncbi:hypothetical protein RJT34_04964 [Clitoria ternatea]|uniref:Uncharacterized protein n=1 Tax=Clitoria ternatea TaxID=43366 RepID=A0AAN9KQU7_CLITE